MYSLYNKFTMPKYKSKSRYNKFQKKAFKRRQKKYRNRQQLLSIKTVKAICKKQCEDRPEVKLLNNEEYNVANQSVQRPSQDTHIIRTQLIDPSLIHQGPGKHQRIGNEILVKYINLRLRIHFPIAMNNTDGAVNFRCGQESDVYIKVLELKSPDNAQISGPPHLGRDLTPDTFRIPQQIKNMTTREFPKYKTVYKKKLIMRNKIAPNRSNGSQNAIRKTIRINRNIKINKKFRITTSETQQTTIFDFDKNWYLWIYAYGLNMNIPANSTNWGGTPDYAPRVDYCWTVYYSDC